MTLGDVAGVAAEAWIETQALRHVLHSVVAFLEPNTFTPTSWEALAEQSRIQAIEDWRKLHPAFVGRLRIE